VRGGSDWLVAGPVAEAVLSDQAANPLGAAVYQDCTSPTAARAKGQTEAPTIGAIHDRPDGVPHSIPWMRRALLRRS
jgi:hypothetical protein